MSENLSQKNEGEPISLPADVAHLDRMAAAQKIPFDSPEALGTGTEPINKIGDTPEKKRQREEIRRQQTIARQLEEERMRKEGVLRAEPVALSYALNRGTSNVEQRIIQEEIHKKFLEANNYVIRIGGPIGDSVMSLGALNGMLAAIHKTHAASVPITIFVDNYLYNLYKPLERQDDDINVLPLDPTKGDLSQQFQEKARAQANSGDKLLLMDFPGSDATNPTEEKSLVPTGRILPRDESNIDMTILAEVFQSYMLDIKKYGEVERHAAYVNALLGLTPQESVSPYVAQPIVPLPANALQRYTELTNDLQIKTDALQIGLVMQSNIPMKMYDLENWLPVLQGLQAALPNGEEKEVNYNVFCGPDDTTYPGYGRANFEKQFAPLFSDHPNIAINFIQIPLSDAAIILQRQNMVMGVDTGLGQIAASLAVPTYTLMLSQEARQWKLNAVHHLIQAQSPKKGGYDFWNTQSMDPGFNQAINTILPETIVATVIAGERKLFSQVNQAEENKDKKEEWLRRTGEWVKRRIPFGQ